MEYFWPAFSGILHLYLQVVLYTPGAMALTRISGANSSAAIFVISHNPFFDNEYAEKSDLFVVIRGINKINDVPCFTVILQNRASGKMELSDSY